jgi:hypothetical protein
MALDKRDTRTAMAGPVIADSVTNRAEFEVLFRRWAEIAVKGFNELREAPPVAAAPPGRNEEMMRKPLALLACLLASACGGIVPVSRRSTGSRPSS